LERRRGAASLHLHPPTARVASCSGHPESSRLPALFHRCGARPRSNCGCRRALHLLPATGVRRRETRRLVQPLRVAAEPATAVGDLPAHTGAHSPAPVAADTGEWEWPARAHGAMSCPSPPCGRGRGVDTCLRWWTPYATPAAARAPEWCYPAPHRR